MQISTDGVPNIDPLCSNPYSAGSPYLYILTHRYIYIYFWKSQMWHVSLETMTSPIVLKLDITSVSSFACLELSPSRKAGFGCDMQRLCARSTHSMFVFLPGASPGSPGKVDDVGKSNVEAEADKKLRLSCEVHLRCPHAMITQRIMDRDIGKPSGLQMTILPNPRTKNQTANLFPFCFYLTLQCWRLCGSFSKLWAPCGLCCGTIRHLISRGTKWDPSFGSCPYRSSALP